MDDKDKDIGICMMDMDDPNPHPHSSNQFGAQVLNMTAKVKTRSQHRAGALQNLDRDLALENLQIGSPSKGSPPSAEISLPFSPMPQPPLWKDYPFVNSCGSPVLSNNSCSYAGSNGLPQRSMSIPPLSFHSGPNFNNYRSSAVADIFGGRLKSRPLILPSRLASASRFPNFSAVGNISCGIFYQSHSPGPDMWNFVENPISRSSSQSSGFVSQKELDHEQYSVPQSRAASPSSIYGLPLPPSNYPASAFSEVPFSCYSQFGSQQHHYRQQNFMVGANDAYFPTSSANSMHFENPRPRSRKGHGSGFSGSPSATCSRFGPRANSCCQKSHSAETENFFPGTDDESDCDSFKTALGGRSLKSPSLRKRMRVSPTKASDSDSELCQETQDGLSKCEDEKFENNFGNAFYQFVRSVFLFLLVVLMFWVLF